MLDGKWVDGYDVARAVDALIATRSAEERVPTWAPAHSWEEVDAALRSIHATRCVLDADEARWLREAERVKVWREVGMVSALDYCERVLGLAPRTAKDRLRVARRLGDLPALDAELRAGMKYSAVKELTRVVIPATERAWIEKARGKSLRQIEELVAGHKLGDMPDDRPDPELIATLFPLAVTPRVRALMLAAIAALREEAQRDLDDDDIGEGFALAVLGERAEDRPGHQLAVTVCKYCNDAEQVIEGYRAPIDAATVEKAGCDCVDIGDVSTGTPTRASASIPPATRRYVWHRDRGRCTAAGCRSRRGLAIHHIVHRADGGDHDPSRLTLLCFACHRAHHEGRITVSGTAPDRLMFVRSVRGRAHVGTLGEAQNRAAPQL